MNRSVRRDASVRVATVVESGWGWSLWAYSVVVGCCILGDTSGDGEKAELPLNSVRRARMLLVGWMRPVAFMVPMGLWGERRTHMPSRAAIMFKNVCFFEKTSL